MSSSLAIVEKKPPLANGGGCAGGVLFHLLDWHRRLFSPRRLLPSSIRSYSPRRLPSPPSAAPPPRPASRRATGADGAASPGVVARLMGLESWPAAAGAAAAPRPQKQRKVEAALAGDNESAVVVVLPPSRRPPAPAHAPRSHHSSDLPARSPRRTRLVHATAAKLLETGARASSRASARLAIAYACSSPQHRKDAGHSGALQQSSGMLDDFLSRSDSMSLERSTPPALPVDAGRDNALSSGWHEKQYSINTMSSTAAVKVESNSDTVVVPGIDSDDANTSRGSSGVDAMRKDNRVRAEGLGSCARIRLSSAGAGAIAGKERPFRKRGTLSRPDVCRSAGSGNLVSSARPIGSARELVAGGSSTRRAAHNCSGPRRELTGLITPQRSTRRDVIDQSGLASTNRNTSNASGLRRGSRTKVDRGKAATSRENRNTVAFASSSSVRPVSRASSQSKLSEKRGFRSTQCDTTCARMPVLEAKCLEAEPSGVATFEKEEFSRSLKAKINELGLSDRVEPSDARSGKLTASVLQELISALTSDTNTSASQSSNYSDSSTPQNNAETVYNSSDRSPDFQKCYQFQGDQETDSSATCTNNEPNQPSPTSVLEACFSTDTSSLGSPTEKIEGKEFFMSMENKMGDLFHLDSDIVDLAMSIDTTKTDALSSGEISCAQNFAVHDFKFLEARLHCIGEAISNAELLLGSSLLCSTPSSLSLHSFIIEMLETIEGLCGGSESLGLTEEKKYQHTNFLFDCTVESLNSKFCNFGKCGYKAWLRLPLTLSRDLLKREVSEEISSWRETSEISSNRVTEKELDQVTAMWDASQVEAFDISVAIENDILEALVDEFAFDQQRKASGSHDHV